MRQKTYWEPLMAALVEGCSMEEAGRRCGISKTMVGKYLKDKSFSDELARRRLEVVRAAVGKMQSGLIDAAQTVLNIVNDDSISAQIRLNACGILFSQTRNWCEFTDILQRLEAVEDALKESEKLGGKGV